MKNTRNILLVVFLFLLLSHTNAFAQQKAKTVSATLEQNYLTVEKDYRAKALRIYLKNWDSPLAENAEVFVETADKYNLDWKFVAAIAGLESSFGHHIPYNSYNAWGYGVYGDNVRRFSSWNDGIETVSKDLREKYMDKWGKQDVYAIGSVYAASPTWAQRVELFMGKIDKEYQKTQNESLSISI